MRRSLVGGDMTSPSSSVETQKVGGGYKLLAGIALTMGVAMVLVILFSHRGFYNVYRFRQEGSGWSRRISGWPRKMTVWPAPSTVCSTTRNISRTGSGRSSISSRRTSLSSSSRRKNRDRAESDCHR